MFNTYYTVYHKKSMKTIIDKLDREGLALFLYETWNKDISKVYPSDYIDENIDINGLIEAVNEEGILLIHFSYDVGW
ncbi:terminal repeat-encoded protein [Staphylococcus phage Stab23]|nr:terminal repeat-encoded protein [Staphylococcus phage Stab23]VEV88762.1 terminal repeat-encoded protein [Staphylococcus phage Stab23]